MYIDPRKINLQDAAGMQLVELIRELGDAIGSLPYDETPTMAGTGSAGESVEYARGDHQHPSDTSKLDVSDGERIENEALNAYPVNEAQGGAVSFDDGSGLKANEVIVGIVPVQSGSGDPAPDNVRAISGWTGAKVVRTGKNIVNIPDYDVQSSNDIRIATDEILDNNVKFKENTQYTFSCIVSTEDTTQYWGVYFSYSDGTGEYKWIHTPSGNGTSATSAVGKTITDMYLAYSSVIQIGISKCQLEEGPVATAYEAYRGTTIQIAFGTEAGTVYGGSLNVTTGVLTVTHNGVNLNTLHWEGIALGEDVTGLITEGLVDTIAPIESNNVVQDLKCSIFKGVSTNAIYTTDYAIAENLNKRIVLRNGNSTTPPDAMLCYPLDTPVSYQLTPTDVELLVGYNALWCDTGDASIEYKADTTAFVNNAVNSLANVLEKIITANIETKMKATKNYTANDLIIANGNLYKASSNIASGATLAVGTNVTATTIAAELASISVGG